MRTLDNTLFCKIEEYIKKYQMEYGNSPSYREIASGVRISSHSLARTYVLALESQGRIERNSDGKIKLPDSLDPGSATLTPLIGNIACGEPLTAIENIEESYSLPRSLFGNGELMMLRANGNSMIEIGIEDRDLIVARKQNYANDGEVVVALIDNEATLKRFYYKNGKFVLHPENKELQDIIVNTCDIQGVLVGCIKLY